MTVMKQFENTPVVKLYKDICESTTTYRLLDNEKEIAVMTQG